MAAFSRFALWTLLPIVALPLSRIAAFGQKGAPATTRTAPAQEGIVKLSDSEIEYFSQGKGEPIVLLPFGGLTVGYMDGSLAEFVGKRAVEKAAPWKSPRAGLSPSA